MAGLKMAVDGGRTERLWAVVDVDGFAGETGRDGGREWEIRIGGRKPLCGLGDGAAEGMRRMVRALFRGQL